MVKETEKKSIIGTSEEDGLPVIWKVLRKFPPAALRKKLPWLAIFSWEYDGDGNNGMPDREEYRRMLELEKILEQGLVEAGACEYVYSRTGNSLKEFVFYIRDKEHFLEALDRTLSNHEYFPVDITFYEDPAWLEFDRLLEDFVEPAPKKKPSAKK